ncbi:biotin-independent malonate decarboxylase gamma subunit [Methylopila capsulata]|uniref:Biotin-independent malonate decarboxylase gamma subunit n=1 Tax=Methylopila capsulata TaxID=61654 RepID=A0A9W6MTC0_9HYPH|nr:biotin-independent malonate decarboxylase subunit gamma [Methylopila capsulata]MBM7853146.1 biotin-independent malonate decarboxylase gamma subunit [Methylopila capsulata]GLK57640.1 biotin-independent malonate decarboxylase subunit gamma [Methylopila capsulata]
MSATMSATSSSRGRTWFEALGRGAPRIDGGPASVLAADVAIGDETVRMISVVTNPDNRFPRAREGEVGLDEGWGVAARVREVFGPEKHPILAIVDVPSQAYGRAEELYGIHLACAAAADAYASARLAGHPVVSLVVGRALSGAFLAHGYQANRVLALDDPKISIHAMGKQAAARVTKRSVEQLEKLGEEILPLAYDVRSFAKLGLVHELIGGVDADAPSAEDAAKVTARIAAAIADARSGPRDLSSRLTSREARENRAASIRVREALAAQWG